MELTNREVAQRVKQRTKERYGTILKCCNAFNVRYAAEIDAGYQRSLNKDFVSRVTRNDFKVHTERISKLCEFLEVRDASSSGAGLSALSHQIHEFREKSRQDIEFGTRFAAVERFLSGLNLESFVNEA